MHGKRKGHSCRGIRREDREIRSPLIQLEPSRHIGAVFSLSLLASITLVGAVGIEPTPFGLKGRCSTTELRPWRVPHCTRKGMHANRWLLIGTLINPSLHFPNSQACTPPKIAASARQSEDGGAFPSRLAAASGLNCFASLNFLNYSDKPISTRILRGSPKEFAFPLTAPAGFCRMILGAVSSVG